MTGSVTKQTRRRRKCDWCREWFKPKPRGAPPRFCSQSCRQRAYEARRRKAASKPLGSALRADIDQLFGSRRGVRVEVLRVLRELGVTPPGISDEDFAALVETEALEHQYQKPAKRPRRRGR